MPDAPIPTPTAAAPVRMPAPEDAAPAAAPSEAVQALLTKLSVALNRRRAYGAEHPMVRQAEADALASVRTLTQDAGTCTIGVAHQELLVDGVPIAASHAVARELAQRLHRRGVGALAFDARITGAALSAGLAWLAAGLRPGGVRAHDVPPAGEGLRIGRVAYDRLVLGDEAPGDDARELAHVWRALAAAAFEIELTEAEQEAAGGGTWGPDAAGGTATGADGSSGTGPPAPGADVGDGFADPSHGPPDALAADGLTADELASLDERTPAEIARAIDRRAKHEPYARHVAYVLLTLANQIQQAPPPLRASLGERLRAVLSQLEQASMSRIIGAIGTGRDQRRFLASVVSALPASAVIDWLELSAHATDQQLSHQLLRLLAKLSRLAGASGADSAAAQSFHTAVHGIVAGWELDDPTPVAHTALLDRIAGADATGGGAAVLRVPGAAAASGAAGTPHAVPAGAADASTADTSAADANEASASVAPADTAPVPDRPGAAPDAPAVRTVPPELAEHARLVQMACEIDAAGEDAIAATEALVAAGEIETLLAWLDAAPGAAAANALREAAVAPGALRAVLLREPFEQAEARALLATVPVAAGPVLFDILGDAEHRTARRMVYDALRGFGPAIMPEVERRLTGSPPWFVTRNLLALVRDVAQDGRADRAGAPLPALTLLPFLDHERPQVRVEALRCLAEDGSAADAAIRRALDDADPTVVAVAIDAAAAVAGDRAAAPAASGGRSARLSRALATRLMELVDTGTLEPERAGRAVRALAAAPSPAVRDWLLGHATRKRLLLGLALADATPSVCAALRILAAQYGNQGEVPRAVELALATTDARRDAAEAGTREALGSRTPPRGGPASERAA